MIRNFFLCLALMAILSSCGPGSRDNNNATTSDTAGVTLEQLNKKIEGDKSNPDLYNERARYYLVNMEFDPALKDVNKAISLSGKPDYYITMSEIYLLKGEPNNTSGALMKALEIDPGNNDVILHLANLNLIIKEYKTALNYVKKSLELEPVNNPRAFFIRALILLENGDTVNAVADLKKSASIDEKNYEAFLQLGELYAMKKDKIAAEYLSNALKIRPESKEALYLLGMFYQETGLYEQALATYARLEKVDSSYKRASYNQGYIHLVYLKNFDKAVKHFSDAIAKDPLYTDAWYNRGFAYELAGDFDKASRDYKRSLEITANYQKAIDGLNRLDRARR